MPQGTYKYPQTSLRLNPEHMIKIKYIAQESGRTATKEIEQLIIKHIKEYETDFGEITSKDIARLLH